MRALACVVILAALGACSERQPDRLPHAVPLPPPALELDRAPVR
jgi:hypothetical protein